MASLLRHEHAALLAKAQACWAEAEEASAAMVNVGRSGGYAGACPKAPEDQDQVSRLRAELAEADSNNARLRTELTGLRGSDPPIEQKSLIEEPSMIVDSVDCNDPAVEQWTALKETMDSVNAALDIQVQQHSTGGGIDPAVLDAACTAALTGKCTSIAAEFSPGQASLLQLGDATKQTVSAEREGSPAVQTFSASDEDDPFASRMKDWNSSLERFRRDTQASADIAAYARRLGSAAGVTLDLAREHALESRVEAQGRELLVLQGDEVLENAALRKDEAWLARLREELSAAEFSLSDVQGQAASLAADAAGSGTTGNPGERLLAQLVQREATKVESVHQESAELRSAISHTRNLANRRQREAALLGDAREAVLGLLASEPEVLDRRADTLRQALMVTLNDIELLREGGRDVSFRSAEVADEVRAVEAELKAERADRNLSRQRERAVSKASDEQQRVSQFLSTAGLKTKQPRQ